jgi:ribosomal protein S18 acetylase RimI-like enzyme
LIGDTALATSVREFVAVHGLDALIVDDLCHSDLEQLGWSGSATHIRHVARQLEVAKIGDAEYLVVRAPDSTPVAKGGISYTEAPGRGTIWQLATQPQLQGMGLGTLLIEAAEARIRARGIAIATLSVETNNPLARDLYERLGYAPCRERHASWESERADGSSFTYETTVTELEKRL